MMALATLLVLVWVLRQPMSLGLGAYFAAQLVALPVLELSWRFLGPGKAYGWVYALATGLVFLAIGNLVRGSLLTARYKARLLAIAGILALVFTRMGFLGLGRAPGWADWLVLVEGGLLVVSGALIGVGAPYAKQPDIAVGLSVLWLMQALVAFSFSLHFPRWNVVDPYARAIVGILGFLFLGWRLKSTTFQKAN